MGWEPRIINQSFRLSAALVSRIPPPFGVGMTKNSARYLGLVIPTLHAAEESRSRSTSAHSNPRPDSKNWLAGFRHALRAGFAQVLDVLRDDFVALLSFRGVDEFFEVCEEKRVLQFFTQFGQVRLELCVDEEHFATETGLEEEIFVEHAVTDERARHTPIAEHLAKPGIFLRAYRAHDLDDLVGALGPEGGGPPMASFANFGFAASVVEFEDEFGVGVSGFRHGKSLREGWIERLRH